MLLPGATQNQEWPVMIRRLACEFNDDSKKENDDDYYNQLVVSQWLTMGITTNNRAS